MEAVLGHINGYVLGGGGLLSSITTSRAQLAYS